MLNIELICQCAGLFTIVGAFFLIFKQKIFLDVTTNRVVSVQLPLFGKVQTNAPTFAVIVLGFAAIIYPVYLHHTTFIIVEQDVESSSRSTVVAYAVAKQTTVGNNKHLLIAFPVLPEKDYEPHLVLHVGSAFWDQPVDERAAREGKIILEKASLQEQETSPSIKPITVEKPSEFK
jgi:hypothetical protein